MYVYNFILADLQYLMYKFELKILIGISLDLDTITTIHEKCSWMSIDKVLSIELQLHEKVSSGDLEL